MPTGEAVQLNVRLPRELKEQGDATLALVGSSPARVIRRVWSCLAQGGEAYDRLVDALDAADVVGEAKPRTDPLARAAGLFESLGASLGLDVAAFEPSALDDHELLERIEWERLGERGLA